MASLAGRPSPRLLAVAAALAFASTPAAAQVLCGTVRDGISGTPVADVRVMAFTAVGVTIAETLTQPDGQFGMFVRVPGVYRLRASRIGYETAITEPVKAAATSACSVSLTLVPRPVSLEPLTVVAPEAAQQARYLSAVGFYYRKRTLGCCFLTRDKIEQYSRNRNDITLVIRHLTGVSEPCETWVSCLEERCQPSVILDGKVIRMGGPPEGPYTVNDLLKPSDLEALEVYRSAVFLPIQWRGFDSALRHCGAIVAWSKP